MDSRKLIFSAAIIAIFFGKVYAAELKEEGGYNLDDNITNVFKHTIDFNMILIDYHTYIYNYAVQKISDIHDPYTWCCENPRYTPFKYLKDKTLKDVCRETTKEALNYAIFSNNNTAALGPRGYCQQYKPNESLFPIFAPGNPYQEVKPSNMLDRQSYEDHRQASVSTSTEREPIFFKFLLSKDEEDKLNK